MSTSTSKNQMKKMTEKGFQCGIESLKIIDAIFNYKIKIIQLGIEIKNK